MSEHKHIGKIVIALMAATALLCIAAVACAQPLTELLGGTGVQMSYEEKLFNTDEVLQIDIIMDDAEWEQMLTGAMSEIYYSCDVVIGGETFRNVGIRPKGNTSLSAIAMDPDSERFSLKLEFDQYETGQSCYGLDKLILNNNYADATNMKEAIIYDMYQYLDADASLYNYAELSLNGEYKGVYLALEAVEESFLLRRFGTQAGELYKPDSMEMGGGGDNKKSSGNGGGGGFGGMPGGFNPGDMPGAGGSFDFSNMPAEGGSFDFSNMPGEGGSFDFSNMPGNMPGDRPDMGASTETTGGEEGGRPSRGGDFGGGGGGGFSMGGNGANLNYTDDELDSYSLIWEGEITGTGKSDHRRVVTALKNISEGTDLEQYMDVDNLLKYMAVHTFSVNMDSLSGSMAHNYYLYEYKGQLNMFPWDYNLSFGGMSMGSSGDATEMVNDAIDTPFSGTRFFDSLLADETYLAQYHAYLQQLVDEYVNGGRFDEVYNRIRTQIDGLVETDPTAFYDYEAYQKAAETFYETVQLRAKSIAGQLDGTIPSTDDGQRADSSALVDASHIDVDVMGQFSMGGFGGGGDDENGGRDLIKRRNRGGGRGNRSQTSEQESAASGETPDMSSFSPGDMSDMGNFNTGDMSDMGNFNPGNMPDMGDFSFTGSSGSGTEWNNLAVFGGCLAAMLLALFGVRLFQRRKWFRG